MVDPTAHPFPIPSPEAPQASKAPEAPESAGDSEASLLRAAVVAADWGAVQQLVERHWSALILDDPEAIRDAVRALPPEVVAANPRWVSARNYLDYLPVGDGPRPLRFRDNAPPGHAEALIDVLVELTSRGAAQRAAGRIDRAERWADEARSTLADATEESQVELQYSLPDLHSQWGKVYEFAGRSVDAVAEYQNAHDLAALTGNELVRWSSAGSLAWLHSLAGEAAQARSWLDRTPRGDAPEPGTEPDWTSKRWGISAHLSRALAHLDALRYEQALEVLVAYADVAKAPEYWAAILFVRARLARYTGESLHVLTGIDSAVRTRPADLSTRGVNAAYLALARAELHFDLDQPARARQALETLENAATGPGRSSAVMSSLVQLALAETALLAGDLAGARRGVDHLLAVATAVPRTMAKTLVLSAAVHLRSAERPRLVPLSSAPFADGDQPDAVLSAESVAVDGGAAAAAAFRQAVDQVRESGQLSAFTVVSRQDFDALVQVVSATGDLPARDLAMLADVAARGRFLPEPSATAPLSRRERSVLAELASGASLAEIAVRLFVSQNTVKSQLRSAYRKLGVANRAEAERAAARLGLVD